MVEVVKLREKVVRVCHLNNANSRCAPLNLTQLTGWLDIGGGTLSARYKQPVADLHISMERAIVMALGFGPNEAEFEQHGGDLAWSRWTAVWGHLWRTGEPKEFADKLEQSGYFVARPPNDARLAALLPKIRKKRVDSSRGAPLLAPQQSHPARGLTRAEGRYLDRLASLQVVYIRETSDLNRLLATCTFGAVEVPTEDATYLVSINRCHAEVLFRVSSFEPRLEKQVVKSRSKPFRQMEIEREYSRLNHPSWLLCDSQPKTPLKGEYDEIELGVVRGEVGQEDEASLLVHKAGFAVSALTGPELEEFGILTSLLRFLVTEHVGEIEQRGNYLYHLSAGPIMQRDHDD